MSLKKHIKNNLLGKVEKSFSLKTTFRGTNGRQTKFEWDSRVEENYLKEVFFVLFHLASHKN